MPQDVVTINVTSSLAGTPSPDFGKTLILGTNTNVRTVADAVTTAGSPTLTSATAAFVAGDLGKSLVGAGIQVGTTIATVVNGTTVTLSNPATTTATAVSITLGGQANRVVEYFGNLPLQTDFGTGTDAETALLAYLGVGVQSAFVTGVTRSATLTDHYASGAGGTLTAAAGLIIDPKTTMTATNNAVVKTILFTAVSPPATPAAGYVAINTETKEWKAAETATGTGLDITYKTLDLASAEAGIIGSDFSIILYADLHADLQALGLLNELQTFCDTNNKLLTVGLKNNILLTEGQAVTATLISRNVVPLYNQSGSDIGAIAAGRLSIEDPWVTLLFKEATGASQTTFYADSTVGRPGLANTIEGGNANNLGPANAVITKQGLLVFSNGLTTAGQSSSYQFVDVTRTRYYLDRRLKIALTTLRLSTSKIPFTEGGIEMVRSTILAVIEAAINAGALSKATTVTMPAFASIPTADKANRVLQGIVINAVLTGDVHSFVLNLNITV